MLPSWRSIRGSARWRFSEYAVVDDCGVRVNPQIVEGQVTGRPHRSALPSTRRSSMTPTAFADPELLRLPRDPGTRHAGAQGRIDRMPVPVHAARGEGRQERAAAADSTRSPPQFRTPSPERAQASSRRASIRLSVFGGCSTRRASPRYGRPTPRFANPPAPLTRCALAQLPSRKNGRPRCASNLA